MVPTRTAVHRVQGLRNLTDSTFVLRFDRGDLEFQPGQYVSVGVRGQIDMREYSIYSTTNDDYLEILVREVEDGVVSRRLRRLSEGNELEVDGPFGFFLVDPQSIASRKFLFVASGTGISPFHSLAGSYPTLDYRLLHGVRYMDERYEHEAFAPDRVVSCVTRPDADPAGRPAAYERAASVAPAETVVPGKRVTDYLRANRVDPDTLCYVCGNCDMIYEVFDILKLHGVPPEQMFAEVYF